MLLCCGSMRASGFIIDMTKDSVYLPLNATAAKAGRETQWLELALHWTGSHYMLPIDKEDSYSYNLVNLTFHAERVETPSTSSDVIQIEYPYGKILTPKDWKLLMERLSAEVG